MAWWGKVICGALGFGLGGPLGAALGAMLGHSFDKGLDQNFEPLSASEQEKIQAAFFTATFTLMGRMAKADGRVSENEIETAKQVMTRMGLDQTLRQSAIDLFQQGKEDGFDWRGALDQFADICGRQKNLKQMFLEIQIQAAYADGTMHEVERQLLQEIARKLGFSKIMLEQLLMMVQAQQYFHQQQSGYRAKGSGYQQPHTPKDNLPKAYQVLGIESSANDKAVKTAYRRLMSQHHPDKLVAKGLPEEMIKVATEKTQEIKSAYETIMKSRGKK
ncbi:co-chaperone DjlA [Pleionea mediterranea]|uniref:Co-chaperone protein DjlA n=1 Tax=Pleionea mediterranea TaxID=523701 RepID=A0A316FYU4_9GAMM|nr:co-chaperone DjlA [Pleionea mediterranea]PWK53821.1 DnaJ like chaperone protein [Pleionea mediterranea]